MREKFKCLPDLLKFEPERFGPAQWIELLDANPDDLRSSPRTHIIKGESQLFKLSSDFTCTHILTHI